MAISSDEVQLAVGGLHSLVEGVLDSFWGTLDLANPSAARDALLEFVPMLVEEYGLKAASIAADWYDELRMDERLPDIFVSDLGDVIPREYIQQRVRYGADHLFSEDQTQMLAFLKDAATGYVTQAFADTIALNAARDPKSRGWVRKPEPGACKFCLMLASRANDFSSGGVYASRESATRVVGRGMERQRRTDKLGRTQWRGKGVKARGSRGLGEAFHGSCRCTAVPIWPDTDIAAQHGFDPNKLYEQYLNGDFD